MSKPAVEIENLSKLYRLGAIGYTTLNDALARWWQRRRNRAIVAGPDWIDPRQAGPKPNTFWALRDCSTAINQGEVVGVIGRNGAGKSTLLKLLSRITEPTEGRAILRGRVGSLLEVGAGFHPELTGRDNIFINGAILGMKKVEISRRLDEIIAFAEIDAFVDTPVKRYSSGMYVRLAFAVAAHLEPDILIVDEVLAVGDAQFQRKCLGRMHDISTQHGRTILFVSHNLDAVQRLCGRSLLLDRGRLVAEGPTGQMVAQYLGSGRATHAGGWIDVSSRPREGSGQVRFIATRISSGNEMLAGQPFADGPLDLELLVEARANTRVQSIAIGLRDLSGRRLVNADTGVHGQTLELPSGRSVVQLRIDSLHLRSGTYSLALWMARYAGSAVSGSDILDYVEHALELDVLEPANTGAITSVGERGVVTCAFKIVGIAPLSENIAVPEAPRP